MSPPTPVRQTKDQLLSRFRGGQPPQLLMRDFVETVFSGAPRHEINIREFVTPNYNPALDEGDNNRVSIQLALDAAKAEAASSDTGSCTLRMAPGNYYEADAPLNIGSGVHLVFDPGAYLYRGWVSPTSDWGAATLRNENYVPHSEWITDPGPYVPPEPWDHDISITCVGASGFAVSASAIAEAAANVTRAGPHIYLSAVRDVDLNHIKCKDATYQISVALYCERCTITQPRIKSQPYLNSGAFWIIGGKDYCGVGGMIHTGENPFALGSPYNVPLERVTWMGAIAECQLGNVIHIVQTRNGVSEGFGAPTEVVRDITFKGIIGKGGQLRSSLIRVTEELGTPGLITDVDLEVNLEHGLEATHDLVLPYGIVILGGDRLTFRGRLGSTIHESVFSSGNNPVGKVTIDMDIAAPQVAGKRNFEVTGIDHLVLGGRADSSTQGVARFIDCGYVETIPGWRPYNIPSSQAAIVVDGTTKLMARGVRPAKAEGATVSTRFVICDSTDAEVARDGCDLSGIDFPIGYNGGTTPPALYEVSRDFGGPKTKTIAAGQISWQGETDIVLIAEGGAGFDDTLTGHGGALQGVRMRVRSGMADPAADVITVQHGTAINDIDFTNFGAANFLLDAEERGYVAEYWGNRWIVVEIT